MKARSTLLMELATIIQKRGMTQAKAAELFGVTQPRISDLTRGKINLFSLDMLMNMASTAGMSPVVKLSKPKVFASTTPGIRTPASWSTRGAACTRCSAFWGIPRSRRRSVTPI